MRLMKLYVLLPVLCLVTATGCNIKEDRSGCPCRLLLDVSRVHIDADDVLELTLSSDEGWICSEKVEPASLGEEFVVEIPRISLRLVAWCGGEGMISPEGLVIPLGGSCPRVYTYMSDIVADCEVVRDTLVMRKNHCVMSIGFKYDMEEDFILMVTGDVCGYDGGGAPLAGEFSAMAVPSSEDEAGFRQVVLPRQCGGELLLEMEGEDGKVRTFRLSDYIDAVGYDWNAPDLEDLKVVIDMARTTISLEVSGWDEEFFFDVVI